MLNTLYKSDFHNKIGDTVTMLSRVYGLPSVANFVPWMYSYV